MSADAALTLLSQMLTGIQHPSFLSDDEPTFSAQEITSINTDGVRVILISPSGDHYAVTVEWLREESP